eukprot:6736915-Prymnesium_polylepis.1
MQQDHLPLAAHEHRPVARLERLVAVRHQSCKRLVHRKAAQPNVSPIRGATLGIGASTSSSRVRRCY